MSFRICTNNTQLCQTVATLHRKVDRLTHPSNASQLLSQLDKYDTDINSVFAKLGDKPTSVELKFLVDEMKVLKAEFTAIKKKTDNIKVSTSKTSALKTILGKSTTSVKTTDSGISVEVVERIEAIDINLTSAIKQIGALTDTINNVDRDVTESIEATKERVVEVEKTVDNVNKELTIQKTAIDSLATKVDTPVQKSKSAVYNANKLIHYSASAITIETLPPASFFPISSNVINNPDANFTLVSIKNPLGVSKSFTIRLTENRRKFALISQDNEYLFAVFDKAGVYMWGAGDFTNNWSIEEIVTFY